MSISEGWDDLTKVVWCDRDVAVGDDKRVVFSLTHQVVQSADFVIAADRFGIDNKHDVALWKFALESLYNWDCRIMRVSHTAQDLKGWVVETAETREMVIELLGGSFKGLQQRDWRKICW